MSKNNQEHAEMSNEKQPSNKILRVTQVIEKTGLPRSTLYHLISQKKFPRQFKLSERTSGFLEHEVDAWLESRANSRSN
jgi:prophage regulatory protein